MLIATLQEPSAAVAGTIEIVTPSFSSIFDRSSGRRFGTQAVRLGSTVRRSRPRPVKLRGIVVGRIFTSWNQITVWLNRLDSLRRAA